VSVFVLAISVCPSGRGDNSNSSKTAPADDFGGVASCADAVPELATSKLINIKITNSFVFMFSSDENRIDLLENSDGAVFYSATSFHDLI
jgi:hypothetical protein